MLGGGLTDPMAPIFFTLLSTVHAFSNNDLFVRDLLYLRAVDECDLGYVFDGETPKIANEILESLNER